ncbi:hypothetical protein ISN45_Aa01g009110 [Arabidopsis thaliana x Arabidopsis arenosa]|uniref:Uncharacterized protein n=2 Tax=Arabidopsis TaxID=3701 RepID=A0A8T2CQR0_ARASU|nr:hypothetical protein ISN45_Aa01g009110 [Arabidopsis thaliana x Arabidopsis arenosa]KAG7597291.1 hypothetical protein ISN44_As06g016790 [Arabidopsis suecica]
MAEKVNPGQVFNLLCIFSIFFFLFVLSVNVSADVDSERAVPSEDKTVPSEDKTTTVWLTKIKHSGKNYWAKLRETLDRGQSHFFPPNTYFTGKNDAPMGTGENMKEAATRSFENSKSTVEEAARSAAEVVSDTAEAVKEKVKRVTNQPEGTDEL